MRPKRIVIVGAGGMAREIASALHWINRGSRQFEFLGYAVTDVSRLGQRDSRDQVLGDFAWLSANRDSFDALAIGVGSPHLRLKLAGELRQLLPRMEWPRFYTRLRSSTWIRHKSAKDVLSERASLPRLTSHSSPLRCVISAARLATKRGSAQDQ